MTYTRLGPASAELHGVLSADRLLNRILARPDASLVTRTTDFFSGDHFSSFILDGCHFEMSTPFSDVVLSGACPPAEFETLLHWLKARPA